MTRACFVGGVVGVLVGSFLVLPQVQGQGAHRLNGVSKVVYYAPGVMRARAEAHGVWGTSPDVCYLSSPLSDDIGSTWVLSGFHQVTRRRVSLTCTQADVSQPRHKRWQIGDQRLIEVDPGSARRLCGFLGLPAECWIRFERSDTRRYAMSTVDLTIGCPCISPGNFERTVAVPAAYVDSFIQEWKTAHWGPLCKPKAERPAPQVLTLPTSVDDPLAHAWVQARYGGVVDEILARRGWA